MPFSAPRLTILSSRTHTQQYHLSLRPLFTQNLSSSMCRFYLTQGENLSFFYFFTFFLFSTRRRRYSFFSLCCRLQLSFSSNYTRMHIYCSIYFVRRRTTRYRYFTEFASHSIFTRSRLFFHSLFFFSHFFSHDIFHFVFFFSLPLSSSSSYFHRLHQNKYFHTCDAFNAHVLKRLVAILPSKIQYVKYDVTEL